MKKFQWLIIGAAVLTIAAWFATQREQQRYGLEEGALLLPELSAQLASIDQVLITPAGGNMTKLVLSPEGVWQVAERGNYPADTQALLRELRKIAAAQRLEAKTSLASNYALLGVEDIDLASDPSLRITARSGTAEAAVLDLIIGKPGRGGSYVRNAGEAQSWLINESLQLPRETTAWLAKPLLDVARTDVRHIAITPASGPTYSLHKENAEQPDFNLSPVPPAGRVTNAANLNRLGAALAGLRLEDVAMDVPGDLQWTSARYQRFDGLQLDVQMAKLGSDRYLRVSALALETDGAIAENASAEAQRVNTLTDQRSFKVSQYSVDAMSMTHEMMLKPLAEADSE